MFEAGAPERIRASSVHTNPITAARHVAGELQIIAGDDPGAADGDRDCLRFPEQPVSPNIPAILLIGFVLGIGAGIGTASAREFSDHSVRSTEELAAITQLPVLSGIPMIITRKEKLRRRKNRWILLAVVVSAIVIGLIIFHYFIMDLEIFWEKLTRKVMP